MDLQAACRTYNILMAEAAQSRGGAAVRMTKRAPVSARVLLAPARRVRASLVLQPRLPAPGQARRGPLRRNPARDDRDRRLADPAPQRLQVFREAPLQYWATAASFRAFGVNEWAARLWPGLTGFLGVLLVFWAGNRLFAPPAGLSGARRDRRARALYAIVGHLLTLDMAPERVHGRAAVFAFAVAQGEATGSRPKALDARRLGGDGARRPHQGAGRRGPARRGGGRLRPAAARLEAARRGWS